MEQESVDIDKLINEMSNPKLGDNANSILGMMKEFNIVLNEFSKTMDFLNRYGVLVPTIRIAAAKLNVDIDKPLSGNLNPTSDWHRLLFERLNSLSPDEAVNEMKQMGKKLEKAASK